ncbi:hypothetical protein DB30_02912 [Enhygromyxa salina]|uniref:Prokaryotic glutathione synthetase ATP-binding domain-containing protein n=1 Tax=Enhygromyxa salina TaxID=215803 RepID=A0A0C2DD60_9BACT|nr:hypothetical protein [Enhygromyxa salina]KIG17637.1 hypothetical protein DB30_02912 [Enhygromyxa salina]
MRIALATCSTLPSHEHDDRALHAALRGRGAVVKQPIWDDPSVDWSVFDAVLIRTTWDYHYKHAAFVAWATRVGAGVPLFNPAPVVAWNTHKHYLRELEDHGVPLAETAWLDAGQLHDLPSLVRARSIRRGFLKPVLGANARDTLRFDAGDSAQLAAAQAHLTRVTDTGDMMLQPYLSSVERHGEVSAIYFDGALSHAVRKLPVAGDYRVQDDYGAHDAPIELDREQLEICEQTLAALASVVKARGWELQLPLLYARVDLLRDDAGRWVLNELEIVEPSLFFRHGPVAGQRLADALLGRVR